MNAGIDQLLETDLTFADSAVMAAAASGLNLSYVWSQISGDTVQFEPHVGVLNPTVNFPSTGNEFVFRLTAIDALGFKVSDQVKVVRNIRPTITMATPPNLPSATPSYVVSEASAVDPDSYPSAMTYLWTIVSGPVSGILNATTLTPTINFSGDGLAVVKLTVSDGLSMSQENLSIQVG